MKIKFKKIVSTLTDLKLLLGLLSALMIMYNINPILNYMIIAVLIIMSIILSEHEGFIILLFLTVFDDILIIDFLGGSILRVIMVILFTKLAFYFFKTKRFEYRKNEVLIFLFFSTFLMLGIINYGFSAQSLTIYFNAILILLYVIYFKTSKLNREKIYKEIMYTIIYSVFIGGVYGLLHLNFLLESNHSSEIARFNGVFEPNFMCVYLNIALLCLLLNKDFFTFKIWRFLVVSITIFACLTISVSGLLLLVIIYAVYIFYKKENLFNRFKFVIIIFLITSGSFLTINQGVSIYINQTISKENESIANENINTPNEETTQGKNNSNEVVPEDTKENLDIQVPIENQNPIFIRMNSILLDLKNGNFDQLTSGRTALVSEFYRASMNRNTSELLFGNGLDTKMVYSNFFAKEKYSHNTYIDFLYNFGIVGFVIIITFLFFKSSKGVFLSGGDDSISKKIAIIRFACLVASLTLTIYSRRLFLIIFLF